MTRGRGAERPQTLAEKILSRRAGRPVYAGETVTAAVDLVIAHDGNRPQALDVFRELGAERVFDPGRVKFVIDHAPATHNRAAAEVHREMRAFAAAQGIELFEAGEGICHQVLPERGHVVPGDVVLGTDSHTTTHGAFQAFGTGVGTTDLAVAMMSGRTWFRVPETIRVELYGRLGPGAFAKDAALWLLGHLGANGATYRAIEFGGPGVAGLGVGERMTFANLAMEMGAKVALFPCDEVLRDWLRPRAGERGEALAPDPGAPYVAEVALDLGEIEPMLAAPHQPDNVHPVAAFAGAPIDEAIVGTCVNGRLEDLEVVARVLAGRRVAPGVRLIVTPASREVYLRAARAGILAALAEAGATVGIPGCTGCTGASGCGVPGDGERVVSAGNRNFRGRLGNPKADIFLASPATVAASAVTGRITDPRAFLGRKEGVA